MRVLVVEDQAKLATVVAAGLRRAGMAVDVVFDGADALEYTASTRYDVVMLDRDLPGVGGDEVCRTLTGGAGDEDPHADGGAPSATGSRVWPWAPMITCPSPSTSASWWPGSAR
jgi:CheY-like chemotaxis protein